MFSKPLAFGILALGCVTAAAGGAYLATRHNAAEMQTTAAAPATAVQAPESAKAAAAAAPAADHSVPATEAAVTPPADPQPAQVAASAPRETPKPAAETRRAQDRKTVKPAGKPQAASRPVDVAAKNEPARTVPLPERTPRPVPQPYAAPVDAPPSTAAASTPPATPDVARTDSVEAPRPVQFDELVLPAASVIGLQVETGLTSERACVEDRVEARVTRDVLVDGRLAIPAGARMLGSVTQVDRGGKVKERARLSIRFHTLVLGNGDEVALRTEPITREGEAPAADSSKKIGGAAVGGAILGAILGGGKGAAIGGIAGAGGGTAMVMAGDRNPATFQAGTIVTARLASPVTIQVHREQ